MRMFVHTVVVAQTRDTVGRGTRDRRVMAAYAFAAAVRYPARLASTEQVPYAIAFICVFHFRFSILPFYSIRCVMSVCVRSDGSDAMK